MTTEVKLATEEVEWKKYSTYAIDVDPDQDDKAVRIRLCSFARPHMRAFHCAWWSYFLAFITWFSISPLLGEIRDDLGISNQQVWTSSIAGVAGTVFMRFLLGPACDKYGARILTSVVLCAAAIPTACTGLVNSATDLAVLRLFIGIVGGIFVMAQYWASRMFTKEIVGTANAVVGGWGNLGGGVTQLVVGSGLLPLFRMFFDGDTEKAWRTVCIVPATVAFVSGVAIYFISDDAPKGNYTELKRRGVMAEVSAAASFKKGACNINTWFLFFQYACCFGVELTMNNAAALYFRDEFDQTTESAAAIASIFGWMNLFARGMGGFFSDQANAKMGMRGRLWVQTILLAGEGSLILVFANTGSLGSAIVVMIFFSLFVQAAEGSSYGIVPYVDPPCTGSISGIVGAGGNTGAVGFGFAFRQLPYREAFFIMGCTIIASSFTSVLIRIKGHSGLFCGHEETVGEQSDEDCDTANNDDERQSTDSRIEADSPSQAHSKANESVETDPESERSVEAVEVFNV